MSREHYLRSLLKGEEADKKKGEKEITSGRVKDISGLLKVGQTLQ